MELTKQVSSLELCKKLKELGWDKRTYFVWIDNKILPQSEKGSYSKAGYRGFSDIYPAPTVAELGEAIGEKGLLKFWNNFPKENTKGLFENLFDLLTNPNVVCNMWIYLKEKNLL